MSTYKAEVKSGQRFRFGKNWQSFSKTLTPERIQIAESSLRTMLRVEDLRGKTFLDAGSGSGLFSLAARNMGAKVHSFDYDLDSVACTVALRSQARAGDPDWAVEEGSLLDTLYLKSLGQFDVVYSWGVLHHTGDMWTAIRNVSSLVKGDGKLFIAIYNDQGKISKGWRWIKEMYCSGLAGRLLVSAAFVPYFFSRTLWSCLKTGANVFAQYRQRRGMSVMHDWFDWLGGLPFEVAPVYEIVRILKLEGFEPYNIKSVEGRGNNQLVFRRLAE